MGKLISFAVNDAVMTPEEIEQKQFQKIHFRIYSNQLNEHGYLCSLKVLKKYAYTIQGKPILAYYKKYGNHGNGDFGGHEHSMFAQEIAVGFFPNDCIVTYEKGEDGTVYLCADGYIWTEYYQHIVDVFNDFDGVKGVSSEIYMIKTEVDEETGIENILQYSFTGLTLLGDYDAMETPIHPAVPGCQGKLVEFSVLEEKYKEAKCDFEKILYCSNGKNQESDQTGSFFNEEIKEAEMDENKVKNAASEVVENAEKVVTTKVKTEVNTVKYDDNYRYVGEENEEHKKVVTEVVQVPEETLATDKNNKDIVKNATSATSEEKAETFSENKEEKNISDTESKDEKVENGNVDKSTEETKSDDIDENDCKADNTCVENVCKEENADDDSADETVNIEEFNALKEKCESLENSLSAKTVECEKLQAKCNSLEEYKNNKETEIMRNTINRALNEVSNVLNAVQMDDWKARSKECAIDDTDKFINELKAFAFDVQEKNGTTKPDLLRNSIVTNDVTNLEEMDMWDRIERKYK